MRQKNLSFVVAGIGLLIGLSATAVSKFVQQAQINHPKSGAPIFIPGKMGDKTLLFNGWTISPAGRHIPTGDMLLGGAFSPDGKFYAISNSGYNAHNLHIIEVETEKLVAKLPMLRSWNGIAWSPDGKKIYVSGGISNNRNDVHIFEKAADGEWKQIDGFKLTGHDAAKTCIAGVAISPDGGTLYVANILDEKLYVIDTKTGKTLTSVKAGDHPYAVSLSQDPNLVVVANIGSNNLAVFNVQNRENLESVATIQTGEHPNAFILSKNGRAYVSCGNSDEVRVYDSGDGTALETIKTGPSEKAPDGSTPNALAISPDNKTLYVANADNNSVCVVDVTTIGKSKVKGYIPTGWYPSALAITPDGKRLIVSSGKGLGTGANPVKKPINKEAPGGFDHLGKMLTGLVSFVDVPDAAMLAKYTEQVKSNNPYRDEHLKGTASKLQTAVPTEIGKPSPIKHVLYIIKENRTYDQVFSDLPQGNGDDSLLLFGREITPNHHALAEQYVLLDNLYCSGEVSADGHPWSTSAYVTEYNQRAWVLSYSGKGALDYTPSVHYPRRGFIWDECKRKGVTYRAYGEYVRKITKENGEEGVRGVTGLQGNESAAFSGVGRPANAGTFRDTEKAEIFIKEFKEFEKTGKMPQFMIMSLGENHTRGTTPGANTPKACVASNDLALGRIVETITKSKLWDKFAIFVIEDDAQNGPDHIDGHRTIGLVISPYTKRKSVDSTMYTTCSMLRTMELILGLAPLSQHDAAATPMFACFTNKSDLTPYTHLPAQIDLNTINGPRDFGALASAKMDWSEYDKIDEDALNRILWHSIKGRHVPYPTPQHKVMPVTLRRDDD